MSSAQILIPDVVQGMSDRANKQCLVESLGNRECLVYMDPENQLYKGSDNKLLFERLGVSIKALEDLPEYIEKKECNKVQGILTGPMGNLSTTMNELTKNITDNGKQNKSSALSKDIRQELYALAGAVDRKNTKEALAAYKRAATKLDTFVLLVSSA